MTKFAYFIPSIVLALAPCLVSACSTRILIQSRSVGWDGCISKESVAEFLKIAPNQISELLIRSEGGDIEAALDLATEIAMRSIPIIIRGHCHSSCANYLLPAATKLTVENNSRIIFHGDARISFAKFGSSKYIDPILIFKLNEYSDKEITYEKIAPRAKIIHVIQNIVLGSTLLQYSDESGLICNGLSQKYWSPSLRLLQEMGFVDSIKEHNKLLFPQIPSEPQLPDSEASETHTDPRSLCFVK